MGRWVGMAASDGQFSKEIRLSNRPTQHNLIDVNGPNVDNCVDITSIKRRQNMATLSKDEQTVYWTPYIIICGRVYPEIDC